MRRTAALLTLLALLAPPFVRGAPGGITTFAPDAQGDSLAPARTLHSPVAATANAIGATLIPVALGGLAWGANWNSGEHAGVALAGAAFALTGMVLGPWTGYASSGVGARGTSGALLRAGALGVAALAATRGQDDTPLGLAFGAIVVSDLWDIARVGTVVARHDAEQRTASTLQLTPRATAGGRAPGLALTLRFGGPRP